MADRDLPDALVSTVWLEDHLGDPDLRVFDCTTRLHPPRDGEDVPYHDEAAWDDYACQHIPGAGFLDLPGELSRHDTAVRFMMPSFEQFATVMGRYGVGEGTRVVLYSAGTPMWASRVWWMLRVAGFDATAVLDGGLDKWLAEGRPIESGTNRYPEVRFVARPRPELLRDKAAVLDRIGQGRTLLVNTLSRTDFRGLEASRYGRPGRIPGSVNLPYADLIDPDSHAFVDQDEAARRLETFGLDEDREILCYCGGGISATMALLMLHRLGFEHLSLYDGSLGEWARDPALPMERG